FHVTRVQTCALPIYIIKFTFVLFTLGAFFSCGNAEKSGNAIKVGVQSGPELKLAQEAKKVAEQKHQLQVELVIFNDYVMPNEARSEERRVGKECRAQ